MTNEELAPSFSTLAMSIGSSALMSMGQVQHPETGETSKDFKIAQFNIDLLVLLKDKTKNNLSSDEEKFLCSLISDLQFKFLEAKK